MRFILILTFLALVIPSTGNGTNGEKGDMPAPGREYTSVFRNKCPHSVYLAVRIPENGAYRTFGWTKLFHNDAIQFDMEGRYYYYYAFRTGGVWHGRDENGSLRAPIVEGRDFEYWDSEYPRDGKDVWFVRREVEDGSSRTIQLTCK